VSFNLKPLLSELNSFRKIFIDCYLLGKKNSNEPVEGMEKNILQSKKHSYVSNPDLSITLEDIHLKYEV